MRRGRDSNPRGYYYPSRFPSGGTRPLCDLSNQVSSITTNLRLIDAQTPQSKCDRMGVMKASFLVTLYYTLASIIGLLLSVIGAAMLVNLVLTTYILKIPRYPSMPPQPFESSPLLKGEVMASESAVFESWKQSYAQWQKEQAEYDSASVEKKNMLATSVSMLVVGLPVLLFHQKELQKQKENV